MCLSTDGTFKQPFWVTVTSKDHMQEKGVVLVQPCDEWNDFKGAEFMIYLMRSKGHIYMVESPNYYRSYQPVFKTLQSLNVNRLSFKEELVKLEKGRLPDFLNPSHTIDSRLVYRTPTIPDTSEPRKAKATSNSTINHDSPESNKPIVAVNSLSSLPPNQTDSATNQINATTSSLAVTSNSVASEIAKSQSMSPPTTQTSSFIMKLKKDIFLPPTPPQLPPTQLPSPTQPPPTPTPPPRDRAFTMQRENEKHKITLEEFFDTSHSDVKSIFDPSQEEAVKTCLQNRIGIIQGPPGCGKTFIGVQMVRLLLSLSSLHKPKIFVLTYKNHALDEFLKGISKYVGLSKLVRIGGRCKDPALENITLRKLRKENQTEITEMVFKNRYEMDESRDTLRATFEEIRQLPYISYDQLYRSLSDAHVYSLLIGLDWDSLSSEETNCVAWQEVDNLLRGENSKSFEDIKFLYEIKDIAFNHWLPSQEEFDDCEYELTGGIQSIQTFSKLTFKQPSEIDKVKKGEKEEENGETMKSEEEIMEAEEEQMMFSEQRRSEFVNEEFNSILKVDDGNSNHQGEQRVKGFCPQAIKKLTENGYNLPYFDEQEDVWQLSMPDRIRLVQLLIAKETNEMLEKFQRNLREFKDECKQKAELETQNEVEILKRKQIIAATVTGASINQELLREIKPQIVIVEEAAEVLEPQLVASIGSWTKYMLLIGDHQQLRPSVDAYHLRKDYNFDISMMERLINNQMPYTTLQMQNRQRVEFAELLLDIYPNLKTNHKRISGHKPATCLEKSVFFWDHQHEETKERSVRNEEEAKRAVDLGLFLVQQGYEPRKITILAMYRGQTKLIRDMMREHVKIYSQLFSCDTRMNKLQTAMTTHADNRKSTTIPESKQKQKAKEKPDEPNVIKIHTVDMYQGDENDFVIVSLVRSNRERNIGFLSERNRRCVAQSRARCGVYFIGNSSMFKEHKTWRPLISKLESDGCLGDKIGLVCKDHPEASFKVKDSKLMALPKLKNFCQQPCGREMDCGKHFCKEGCQVPHTHSKSACKELVLFEDERCQLHHEPYQRPCCSLRNFCKKLVPFTFEKCGHDAFKECYKKAAWLECETPVLHAMVCGHVQSKQCHEDGSKLKCKEKCQRKMSCGHICSGGHKCFEHSNKKSCRDCTNIERAERKKRRKAEEEQKKANERNVKEHIKKLENSEDFEKMWCTELTRENPETIEKYLRIQDAVKKAINQGHRLFPKITKIEEVRNLKVHAKFLEKSLHLYENEIKSESKLFFHGVNDTMLESILKDGFTLPDESRSYGAGIYLTIDSTQSRNESQSDQSGKMLYCQVHLGRSWTAKEESPDFNAESLRKLKKDSVFAPRSTKEEGGESLSDQYIVFNPDQVLPSYVISYDLEFQPSFIEVFGSDFAASKNMILPKREFNTDDVLQKHFKFVEARFLNMLNKARKPNVYEITKIDFYENPTLRERFLEKQREFEDKYPNSSEAEPIYGFHGTKKSDVVCEIMNNNFKASTRGKFGAGVYFSEQPDYTFRYGGKNNLILARILPGKIKECDHIKWNSDLCTEGYDSHGAFKNDDDTFQEVVIFDTEQILPCYVIHFKLV
uniref:Poly [ADP-ribose] polymerase n=2 Tax=Clytia hemisphaerica TaxID=252671 RepID=A0A7M6DR67_9CNID